jgi:hypothetical protein
MESILPSARFKAVTKSDTVPQTYTCVSVTGDDKGPVVLRHFRYLYVGVTGDVYLKSDNGTSVKFTAVPAGSVIIADAMYVMNSTTATDMVCFF